MNDTPALQINGCEIRRVENGYVLTVGSRRERIRTDSDGAEYAFETFQAMVIWMADNLVGGPRKVEVTA